MKSKLAEAIELVKQLEPWERRELQGFLAGEYCEDCGCQWTDGGSCCCDDDIDDDWEDDE